ncbi:MAG TPA: hypothetical protein VGJ30_14105 [Candidatus Angelobacter sp.]
MTAEIAILNRSAVALAADSAVTLQSEDAPPKIYNTNKLFALSKYHPVGVMIYGNAEFMGFPWETLIKAYRSNLGQKEFQRLGDYGADFLKFLGRNSHLFPPERQKVHFYLLVAKWLGTLKHRWKETLREEIKKGASVSPRKAKSIFQDIVEAEIIHLRNHKTLGMFSRVKPSSVLRTYRDVIRQAIKNELQSLATGAYVSRIESTAALVATKEVYFGGSTGVVVAGFGKGELFPAMRCYELDSVFLGKLRAREDVGRRANVTFDDNSIIHAFAQTEMVGQFMDGIDGDFREFIVNFVNSVLLKGYPDIIARVLKGRLSDREIQSLTKQFVKGGKNLVNALVSDLGSYSRVRHSDPIVEIVNALPKEELAAMAESLVNLTSFKRHVTRDAETVGGPIDVAVISRADGFIWIKRKHYFKKELNPQFFSNYYMDTKGKL